MSDLLTIQRLSELILCALLHLITSLKRHVLSPNLTGVGALDEVRLPFTAALSLG